MTLRLVLRTLAARPVRTAVLSGGFGFGVAVMAALLGVGDVILEQARSPALRGGGDLVVVGRAGDVTSARYLLSSVIGAPPLAARVAAVSPTQRRPLFLVEGDRVTRLRGRGGIPSLEKAVGDPEVARVGAWTDAPADRAWAAPDPGELLRAMDRFHSIPEAPSEAALLAAAPDLDVAGNTVRLEGLRYRIALDLAAERGGPGVKGEIALDAPPGRSVPPFVLHGRSGWLSGYVVPVLSGPLSGALEIGGARIALDGAIGYHDHNWGFWRGVSWQWGQVTHEGYSFLYGRVRPPPDATPPDEAARIPGILAVIGPGGPIAFAKGAQIEEASSSADGRPESIQILAREAGLDVRMDLHIEDVVRTALGRPGSIGAGPTQFLQLRARYHVTGRVGDRRLDFTALGSAETFRGGSDLSAASAGSRSPAH